MSTSTTGRCSRHAAAMLSNKGVVEFCEIFVTNHYKDLLQFVSNPPDKSNQLCLVSITKSEGSKQLCRYSARFCSNLFYSAFFGRISVNLF